jgi:hypothetical protein
MRLFPSLVVLGACGALLFVVGCGAAETPATPEQQFLGTWQFASGDNRVVCPTGTTSQKLTGNVTVQKQSGGGLVVVDAASCNFAYTLSGDVATLGSDKACSFAVPELGQGATADVTYDGITLTTHDGKSMTDVFNGQAHYTTSAGSQDCAFSGSATLSKLSGP